MYFEIYKKGKLIKRGKDLIGDLGWDNELMLTPSIDMTLPIYYLDYLSGREEVKVFINDKCFWGIVTDIEVDKNEETIRVDLEHVIDEWTYRQISVNNAVKDKAVNVVFKGATTKTGDGVTVSANPFSMTIPEANRFTNNDYVERASASAWTTTGETVTVTADSRQVRPTPGKYQVGFTAKGVTVFVEAEVLEGTREPSSPSSDPTVIDQLADIFADKNFAYPGWSLNYSTKAKNTVIDYVYSRQNKLEALTKTVELTEDLFWRVRFVNQKVVDVSEFGEKKPYIISMKPSGKTNIRMLSEPTIDYDFDNVINLATVYSEKADTGMSSMTLREVYNDPSLQIDGFPVVILRNNVNNERDYRMYTTQYPKLAPNNELEYAVIDEVSVALESGVLIEGTYAFTDLSPFTPDTEDGKTKQVTDADRIKAATVAYHAVIKKLKQARRSYKIRVETEQIPVDVNVGDRVRLLYDNRIFNLDACSNYFKKILSYDDYFYITRIEYNFEGEVETNMLTLEKYLKVDRDIRNE